MFQLIPMPSIIPWLLGFAGLIVAIWMLSRYDRMRGRSVMWLVARGILGSLFTAGWLTLMFYRGGFVVIALYIGAIVIASYAGLLRLEGMRSKRMMLRVALAYVAGVVPALAFMYFLIFQSFPLTALQFAIPLAGLLCGNCMHTLGAGVEAYIGGVFRQRGEVEAMLMLGASGKQATKAILADTCEAALRGVFSAFGGIGTVALPGLFVGMVMAGTLPVTAIMYQIGVLMALFLGVSISIGVFIASAQKQSFVQGRWVP